MYAQESPARKKIRDVSPDKTFALRISCSSERADPDNIDLDLITAAELVSLPSKNNVIKGRNYSGSVPDLIWSKGSTGSSVLYPAVHLLLTTYVYHKSGDDFVQVDTDDKVDENSGNFQIT